MIRTPDVEDVLRDYFADDGLTAPDSVLDVVERRISVQRQQRSWRLFGRLPMNQLYRFGAAAAALLVLAVVGYNLLPGVSGPGSGGSPVPSPQPTTTVSPAQSPSPAPTPESGCLFESACSGRLAAGENASRFFAPRISFTTPDDQWFNSADLPTNYQIDSSSGYILLWAEPAIVVRTAACDVSPSEGFGDAPSDWIDFLTTHEGLEATNIHPVTIDSHAGVSIDLVSRKSWQPACAEDRWISNLVQFIGSRSRTPFDVYGVTWEYPLRLVVLDVEGRTILISFSDRAATFDTSVERGQTVIDSMRFAP